MEKLEKENHKDFGVRKFSIFKVIVILFHIGTSLTINNNHSLVLKYQV